MLKFLGLFIVEKGLFLEFYGHFRHKTCLPFVVLVGHSPGERVL